MGKLKDIAVAKRHALEVYEKDSEKLVMVRSLQKLGWKSIGKGSFAIVMAHPDHPSVVLKVSSVSTHRNHKYVDAWHDLAFWMIDERVRSKYLPRVYDIFGHRHSHVFITVIERLYPVRKKHRTLVFNIEMAVITVQWDQEFRGEKYDTHQLRAIAKILWRIKENVTFYCFDIHRANIMVRACGTPVIVDPIVSY